MHPWSNIKIFRLFVFIFEYFLFKQAAMNHLVVMVIKINPL